MQNIYKKNIFFYFFLAVFLSLYSLHTLTGYADNGDYARSTQFLFKHPVGFQTLAAPSTEKLRPYWYDKWVFSDEWPNTYRSLNISSYKAYLWAQAHFSNELSQDTSQYSIILGSVLSRLLLLSAFAALLFVFRRNLPPFAFWFFAIPAAIVLLDTTWAAFLNSFYEEQIAIIFFPVLAFLLIRYLQKKETLIAIMLLACTLLIATSRGQYFYLPMIIAFFVFPRPLALLHKSE